MNSMIRFAIFMLFIIPAMTILPVPRLHASELPGEKIFTEKGCTACHTVGQGKLAGPDLLGVTKRRETEWLKKWLKSPDTMVMTDPIAKELLKEYFVPMPNQGLNDNEIQDLIEFFTFNDKEIKE